MKDPFAYPWGSAVPSSIRRKVLIFAAGGGLAVGVSLAAAGTAMAVSGGPYSSPQQDCPWYGSDWNTPQDQTYPGCHNVQLNVESGGTTNGNADNGWNDSPKPGDHGKTNTTWAQFGNDQAPNDSESQATPTELGVAYPGQADAYHAGCLSFNTDGTGGGPAPEQPSTKGQKTPGKGANKGDTAPESPSQSNSQDKYGCGNNPNGAGFALTYDYYNLYDGYGYCTVGTPLEPVTTPVETGVDGSKAADECGQMANGQSDAGSTTLTPDTGTQQSLTTILTQGVLVYFGADDNLDNGEHDGEGPFTTSPETDGDITGPSDGGGIILGFTPQNATNTPSATHPEGLANLSTGFCADGNCANATTQQETVYYGCGANTGENQADDRCTGANKPGSSRDAANYAGKDFGPYNCNSGSAGNDSTATCGQKGQEYYRQQEASDVNAEPGVQFYQDPDPEGSPATPLDPNPAVYAGTCGVVLGGGGTNSAGDPTGVIGNHSFALPPGTPETNSAGQVVIDPTGC